MSIASAGPVPFASLWLPLLALAAEAPPASPGAAPSSPTVAGELHGGVNAPLGLLGVALVLRADRFSIGAGLGLQRPGPDPLLVASGSSLSKAVFGRIAILDRPRYRIALAIGLSGGAKTESTMTAGGEIFWTRSAIRYDVSATGEIPLGPVWLGLEGGVGFFDGGLTCTARELTPAVYQPCAPGESSGRPDDWVPFAALSIRYRDRAAPAAFAESTAGATAAQAGDGPKLRLLLAGATVDGTDVFSDGHFNGDTDYSGGIEGDVTWSKSSRGGSVRYRIGAGLRYEIAHVPARFGQGAGSDHLLYAPILLGLAIPLVGAHEIELLGGLGIAAGLIRGGVTSDGSPFLKAIGPTFELALAYWAPITRTFDLSVGAALSVSALGIRNSDDVYFANGSVLRGLLPLRLGARWSL
jgi:hypothetical protein